jgi:hypothetical protein
VRGLVPGAADHVGWVRAPAGRVLATYFVPGQRYLGGRLVAPTDEIIVIKGYGVFFDHLAPPGARSPASLALVFYDATTRTSIPFYQMWDGDAPDLGVGADPGIGDRALAAKRWDLRLLAPPTVLGIPSYRGG